ncbi:MAG: helicase-exonuclease AddAB subunit AddA [Muricoprocola sp.]
MAMNWTSDQQKVIDLRDCNILVSAAAGSGKTAVLVERIFSMITDEVHPIDIDHLLIVTFTNAAAGEMKDRIRGRLEEELEKADLPEQKREHLQRQISLVGNAQISTIHSFCQYVIRNHFHTIDLDPDFRIADEGEQKLLQGEVLEQLLEDKYAQHEQEFLHMMDCFATGRDDRNIEDLILQIYGFSRSFPWPEKWLKESSEVYDLPEDKFWESAWISRLMELVKKSLMDIYHEVQRALAVTQEEDGPHLYKEALESDLEKVETLLAAETYQEAAEIFEGQDKWAVLSRKKDPTASEEKKEKVKSLRDGYKKLYKHIQEEYFYASPQELQMQMKKSAPAIKALVSLVQEFADRYAAEKERKGMFDFNDLEHFALKILIREENGTLVRSDAAKELAGYYEEILIDEYQDSNLVQELLLTSISRMEDGKYNLFMVGDVKQSIYRFRQARPELFTEKYETYSLEEGNQRRIDLHQNFRSRHQVLDSSNQLFYQIMGKDLGNVEYDEAAALCPGAAFEEVEDQAQFETEIMLLDLAEGEKLDCEESERELEARMVGNRIKELLKSQMVWDKEQKKYRLAQYGDIVILLRTISGWAEVFAKKLGEMGIPVYTGSRTGYFSAPEVQTVLSLLQLIDNPRQDIPMAAVLMSPIVGVTAKELAEMRAENQELPFYEICMKQDSLLDFFHMLDRFRDEAAYTSMQDFLWNILEETGYLNYVTAMPGGAQRRANLEMLIEKAVAFENGSYHGLYHFVRYIENLQKYEMDFGEAGLGSGEENVVRMMSIHKSKGLEFPIVFVAGMGKTMNQMDARSAFLLHCDLGIGCDYVDPILRVKNQTLLKKMMKTQIAQENLGEELRVLYVAMTRAKEKLILTGAVKNLEEKKEKWMQKSESGFLHNGVNRLSFSVRNSAGCYLDWLMPAYYSGEGRAFGKLQEVRISELVMEELESQAEALWDKEELEEFCLASAGKESIRQILDQNLRYQYPFDLNLQIPNKVSVSEIKKLSQMEAEEESLLFYEEQVPVPFIPDFMKQEKEATGAARGTAYHRIMECIDFSKSLESELNRMLQEGLIREEELALTDRTKISKFLSSKLAGRMAKAQKEGKLFREQQFFIQVQADTVSKEWDSNETVLIQGIIDAYFIEENEIVLVDYKTDFVKFQEASSLYQKYKVQLDYYEKALVRLTGLQVKEKMIYSFCLNREIRG